MPFDYAAAAASALELIQEFGQSVTMTRTSAGTFDPGAGSISGATTQTQTVVVVSLPASGGTVQAFDDRLRQELIAGRLRFFYMAPTLADGSALTFVPKPGDLLTFEGKKWELAGSTPLNPAGTPVLYNIAAAEGGRA